MDFQIRRTTIKPGFLNWGQEFLNLPELWRRSRGEGMTVGIVDSGIAISHPDLKHAVIDSRDFAGSTTGVGDETGHGTHVAGIVAAKDDGQGVVGIAPSAKLLNAKVVLRPGVEIAEAVVAQAIDWVVATGAGVVCLSIAWPKPVSLIEAAIDRATAQGRIVVCAAGNRGPLGGPVGYPARYANALAVGYVTRDSEGRPRGTRDSAAGPEVDIVAPGGDVLSTFPPNIYAEASGTSFAAPFVAGVLALLGARLLKEGKPPLDVAGVEARLKRRALKAGGRGRSDAAGWGLIDPAALLSE